MDHTEDRARKIRALNDAFRQSFEGGDVFVTRGVQDLGAAQVFRLMDAVQAFEDFTAQNDPHDEHDFGVVHLDGEAFM